MVSSFIRTRTRLRGEAETDIILQGPLRGSNRYNLQLRRRTTPRGVDMTRLIGVIVAGVLCLPIASIAQEPVVTLRADVVIDGTGNTLRNTSIVVRGTKIQSIGQTTAQGPVYDLRGLAVMPGWIDTHAHISGHFDRKTGRLPEEGSETPQQTMLYTAGNAYRTLLAGFTTVQSPGAEIDKDLRDWIADRIIPGPRILTSLRAITDKTGTPEQIRAFVRKAAADGADVIKLFATSSIRDGGQPPMDAILAATSTAARSLALDKTIGTIAPGFEADIIATDGNPLQDITAVRRVVFVMKGGVVYRNDARTPSKK